MHKGTVLFFFLTLALAGRAQSYSTAETILSGGDTLSVGFKMADTAIGDTVYFGMDSVQAGQKALLHFFQRHLHAPAPFDSASSEGLARVYFVIDKTGRVTQAWYNALDNANIGLVSLDVVNHFPILRPSSIKGEAVITRVALSVVVQRWNKPYAGNLSPDVLMTLEATTR